MLCQYITFFPYLLFFLSSLLHNKSELKNVLPYLFPLINKIYKYIYAINISASLYSFFSYFFFFILSVIIFRFPFFLSLSVTFSSFVNVLCLCVYEITIFKFFLSLSITLEGFVGHYLPEPKYIICLFIYCDNRKLIANGRFQLAEITVNKTNQEFTRKILYFRNGTSFYTCFKRRSLQIKRKVNVTPC